MAHLITEWLGTPEPIETWDFQCHADSPLLERYGHQSMLCTRPEGHGGPHMAAYEPEGYGGDVIGPVWLDDEESEASIASLGDINDPDVARFFRERGVNTEEN